MAIRTVDYGAGQVGGVLVEATTSAMTSDTFYMGPSSAMSVAAPGLQGAEKVTIQYQSAVDNSWHNLTDGTGNLIAITAVTQAFDDYNTALNYRVVKDATASPVGVFYMRSIGRGV